MRVPVVRKGQGPGPLDKREFIARFRTRFDDPEFERLAGEIDRIAEVAWSAYCASRKSPRTRKAGAGFADPDYELSVEWLAARDAVRAAQVRHDDAGAPRRVLLVIASPRNDQTCPGENSKSYRLAMTAQAVLQEGRVECDLLDLSVLASEYGRTIHPCKACVSTAMPLCHWPCSCYPNHALGQTGDWMHEIYPRWVAAHGIMIVTPVHWLQAPSALKLMIDRLVCADGGNPDPTRTRGKNPELAKQLELDGWPYPRHLAGRVFSIVVHGDTEGVRALRRSLVDWLTAMKLVQAGDASVLDRYVGYYAPYATSHEALDRDSAFEEEVRNAARSLINAVHLEQQGRVEPDAKLVDPRPK